MKWLYKLWIAVGADVDEDRITLLLKEVEGKDITELIASGREKLASVPSGGGGVAVAAATGGGGAPAAAAAESKKEEKVEEKEESDDVSFVTFSYFFQLNSLKAKFHKLGGLGNLGSSS